MKYLHSTRGWIPGAVIGIYALAVFVLHLYVFGKMRSFPLLSDDGAANFVSMVHAMRAGDFLDLRFKLKWFEGLGQPNLFYSSLFDPFNWLVRADLAPADALRIGYAARATVCWLLTVLLVLEALPRSYATASTAATINVLLCFLLGTPGGVPAWAGIHHMSQVALFPGLLWAWLRLVRRRAWLGLPEAGFAVFLLLFLANYPLNSLIGLAILCAAAGCAIILGYRDHEAWPGRAAIKLAICAGAILFFPAIGLYGEWSALTSGSARLVFNHELQSMLIPGYEWPNFWRYGMPQVQIVVVLALGILMYSHPFGRATCTLILTLVVCVLGVQMVTIVFAMGYLETIYRRLPAASRIELYLPPLYSICAAIAVHYWWRIIFPAPDRLLRWILGAGAFVMGARIVLGLAFARIAAVVLVAAAIGRLVWVRLPIALTPAANSFGRYVGVAASLSGLLLGVGVTLNYVAWPSYKAWRLNPNAIHAPFGAEALCRKRGRWLCEDAPGPSVNAADFDVTQFLRRQLSAGNEFAGRAEFLVGHANSGTTDPRGRNFRDMVSASSANWDAARNGMVLLAMPFQGIPVASSYEQVLDYKYYLLWSRYVNRGAEAAPTVNFTTLSEIHPSALGLIGVRYVVSRNDRRLALELPVVQTYGSFTIHEVPYANVAGYFPEEVRFAENLTDELRLMRDPAFDPRRTAVLSTLDREKIGRGPLSKANGSSIGIDDQIMRFRASSAGGVSLAVLPFRHSHCWRAEWIDKPGQIVRTNLGLVGIAFQGTVELALHWEAGYFGRRDCLRRDNDLIPQGLSAAATIPF